MAGGYTNGVGGGVPGNNGQGPVGGPGPTSITANDAQEFVDALLARGERLYNIKVSREVEDELIRHIRRDFEDAFPQMERYRRNMIEMNENWRGATDDTKDFPFEDCSNVRVPLTSTFKEQMQSRFMKAFFSGRYIAHFSSLDQILKPEEVEEFNGWFDWELRQIVKLKSAMRDVFHGALVYGNSFPEAYWEHRTGEMRSFKRFALRADADPREQVEAALQSIVESEPGTTVTESPNYGSYKTIDRLRKPGKVVFCARMVDETPELVAEITRHEVVFDGAQVWVPNIEDYVVIPTGGTVEEVPFWGNRIWLSVEDYRQGILDQYYRDLGKDENLRICQTAQVKIPEFIAQEETVLQDQERGTDQRDSAGYTPSRKWIEVYKWEGWWRLTDKGENDESRYLEPKHQYAVWVSVRSWRIIKIARLEDLNKDGKRSPVHFGYIHEPNRLLDIGLAEWLRHMQATEDGIFNQRNDAGILTNVPWGFYKPMAGFNKEVLHVQPGEFKPVADPASVVMPQSNWQPIWSFQEEALVRKYAGEQAGLSEPAMGQFINKRASASEFVGTASAVDLRTEAIVDYMLESFHELVYRILGLYQQFGPRRRIYQIAGEDGLQLNKEFDIDRLQGRIVLRLSASLDNANKDLQQKIALDMLQILMNQIFIQLGVVGPDTIYCALRKMMHEFGYTDVPFHKPDMPPRSDPPDIENKQFALGAPVIGPTLSENFQEHLQVHSKLASDPEVASKLSPEAQFQLGQHIQATVKMQMVAQAIRQIQAAQAMQAQAAMAEKGINPGKVGSGEPGAGAGPGTAAEGTGNPAASTPGPVPAIGGPMQGAMPGQGY